MPITETDAAAAIEHASGAEGVPWANLAAGPWAIPRVPTWLVTAVVVAALAGATLANLGAFPRGWFGPVATATHGLVNPTW